MNNFAALFYIGLVHPITIVCALYIAYNAFYIVRREKSVDYFLIFVISLASLYAVCGSMIWIRLIEFI